MIVARTAAIAFGARQGFRCTRLSRVYTSVVLSNVPLDVSASAACVRTNSILQGLARLPSKETKQRTDKTTSNAIVNTNNQVHYVTSAETTSNNLSLESGHNIQMIHLPPNRSDLAQDIFGIQNEDPLDDNDDHDASKDITSNIDLVIFDRFYVEEAHSFRFRKAFPRAAMVLDMQDMHSLRWGRQAIVEHWDKQNRQTNDWDPLGCLPEVMEYLPTTEESSTRESDRFLRELASIHRSDLVLVCSPQEMHWLESVYQVPKHKLVQASFFVEPPNTKLPDLDTANPRFVFCGGFKHAPNADAVRILMDCIWPHIRSQLPTATLHIYGAHCPDQLKSNRIHKNGIFVHGFEPHLETIFESGILLAPLRFGAGIKGKIIDAWTFGMPVVTTPIGSEGMTMNNNQVFGGGVASNLNSFCQTAIHLATHPDDYRTAQTNGRLLLDKLYSATNNWNHVQEQLLEIMDHNVLAERRKRDYTQGMLWHQSMRSTEYFSRWVEIKEKSVREKDRKS